MRLTTADIVTPNIPKRSARLFPDVFLARQWQWILQCHAYWSRLSFAVQGLKAAFFAQCQFARALVSQSPRTFGLEKLRAALVGLANCRNGPSPACCKNLSVKSLGKYGVYCLSQCLVSNVVL